MFLSRNLHLLLVALVQLFLVVRANKERDEILFNTLQTLNGLDYFRNRTSPACMVAPAPFSQKQVCCKFLERGTEVVKCLPNLIIVGTQKGGTTAMFYYLMSHPQVRFSKRKEMHLIASMNCASSDLSEDCQNQRIMNNFIKLPTVSPGRNVKEQITIEADPFYFVATGGNSSKIALTLRTHFPTAKIVLMVRDPVDRYFSAVTMNRHMNDCGHLEYQEYMDAQIAYMKDPKDPRSKSICEGMYSNLFQYGFYGEFLEGLYKIYPKKDVLVIEFDEFNNDPDTSVKRVLQHIRLESNVPIKTIESNLDNFRKHHAGWGTNSHRSMPQEMKAFLAQKYYSSNEYFFQLLGKRYDHWMKP